MPEPTAANDAGRRIQAVDTSCEILEALRDLDGAGISELADELDWSKATIHGHLATLMDNEFVVKRGGTYEISLRFVDIGEYAKSQVDIHDIAVKEVDRLAEETGEVAQFMVKEHGRGVYLHKASGENAIQTASYTGNRKDLHCTALGKAILSQLPESEVDEVIERHGLPARTEKTVTTREELFENLEEIRERGVAFDDEEILQGLRCIAAPIEHPKGNLHGAISISGPTNRFKGERFHEELPEIVQGAANVIEVNATQV
ncbi:IclR family transcriptional regulator [Haloarcula nitratireducens]|uniref:IclR family transcriptional regulator n=1 Tax=Haloarcula nitratireducens TaxID=2487749 RepID=A0AAW4PF16_9EURY|nr:IclR family transcriptional regulator [Halomicroarcula nitratireducens]MBX0296429.1 IclR family transcriptional regulator [Halomicroarcula nitratireducens]